MSTIESPNADKLHSGPKMIIKKSQTSPFSLVDHSFYNGQKFINDTKKITEKGLSLYKNQGKVMKLKFLLF